MGTSTRAPSLQPLTGTSSAGWSKIFPTVEVSGSSKPGENETGPAGLGHRHALHRTPMSHRLLFLHAFLNTLQQRPKAGPGRYDARTSKRYPDINYRVSEHVFIESGEH